MKWYSPSLRPDANLNHQPVGRGLRLVAVLAIVASLALSACSAPISLDAGQADANQPDMTPGCGAEWESCCIDVHIDGFNSAGQCVLGMTCRSDAIDPFTGKALYNICQP